MRTPGRSPLLGVSTTIGFAGVLLMGIVSWILLLIDRNMPLGVVIGVSLLFYTGLVFLFLRNAEVRQGLAGAMAGVIGGAASLIFIGALMTEKIKVLDAVESHASMNLGGVQFDKHVVKGTVVYEPGGFTGSGLALGAGVVVGMILLGWGAGKIRARAVNYAAKDIDWRARFAWVVALSYLPLIAVGGLVTSTESGLAVPDSFTTYGAIGILFPLSLMDDIRIYMEHSHRIFGTFSGVATLVLVVRMFGGAGRMLPRVMSVVLLVGVSVQGIMGALRVSEESQALAAVHGVLAQLVFALAIAVGVVSSQRWESVHPSDEGIDYARSTRTMLLVAAGAMGIQLVFGSMTRHTESGHALMSHIGFSFIVLLLVLIAGAKCIRLGKVDSKSGAIRPYGSVIHGLITVQFVLGWGALAMTRTGDEGHPELPRAGELANAHGIRVGETLIATSHHVIGALLLAAVVGALMWAVRIALRPKIG